MFRLLIIEEKIMKDKKKLTKDLDPHQERVLREMISKEMIAKIQRRVDNEDSKVLKTFRSFIDETTEKKKKMESKLKKILKEKKQDINE